MAEPTGRPGDEPNVAGVTALVAALVQSRRALHRAEARLDQQRRRFEGQLQHLADHDPLTGLYNRHRLEHELERELSAGVRYGTGGAVLALGIDNFRRINDELGHATGDELIARVAQLLRSRMRASDVIGRLGGDEFALVLPHVDREQATVIAGQLIAAIRDEACLSGAPSSWQVSASAGVAPFRRQGRGISAETLLVEAEVAMYDAKEAGRDRVAVFDWRGDRDERRQERLTWLDRVRAALADDRFVLEAQPIQALGGDGTPRYELLLRMIGDSGELVPPGAFLPVAEQADLILEVDRYVVGKAIALLAEHQRGGSEICLEVNLSARSVTDSTLLTTIASELSASGVDPAGLVFEVTETAAITGLERAKRFARGLSELGCGFALDDFGAGFASLYYLKHLDFDFLKIDREFIRDLADDPTSQVMVESLVALARGLGKQTIAEGVEDERCLRLLEDYGVDYAQGFLIGRPRPTGEVRMPRKGIEGETLSG